MKTIDPKQTAQIISEVLPYIQQFRKKVIVIKFGGHAMIDDELKYKFASDITLLTMVGMKVVVVHGGGPQIAESLKKQNIESQFINGLRKTTPEVMRVVEEALMNINHQLCEMINFHSKNNAALSIYGRKSNLFFCQQQDKALGLVGRVMQVNTGPIWLSFNADQIPIVCPVGSDEIKQSYNINADVAASKLAIALGAEKLIFLTDISGVLDENQQLINRLDIHQTEKLIKNNVIKKGMIPKVNCALEALMGGVNRAHIIDGRLPHAILLELLTNKGIGTAIDEVSMN